VRLQSLSRTSSPSSDWPTSIDALSKDFQGYASTELIKKRNEKFVGTESPRNQIAFDTLKTYFIEAPILRHCEPFWPAVIETDASNFAIGAVLSQVIDGRLHPIVYHSRKMDKAEIYYEIHDKEMLVIVSVFKE
jgi:hypothetical protein